MIIKMTDVETHINPRNVDIGDIGSRFYTEDENTAFIRIRINYNGSPVDLTKTDMKPKLDLFMEDGSVFIDETIDVLIPESGLIQYDIPSNVIKHIGKVNCKLFMESTEHSVHVANFSFSIVDSGVEKAVAKEINLNLVKDTVKQIMSEDLTVLLNDGFKDKLTSDLENYLSTHNEEFKGPKGDKGDTGPQGIKGDTGAQGPQGDGGTTITDTGKIALTLENGATEFASSDGCFYRVVTIGTIKYVTLKFRYYASKNNVVIARVPNELSTGTYSYIIPSFSNNFNLITKMYIKGTFIYLNANDASLINSNNSITAYLTYTI